MRRYHHRMFCENHAGEYVDNFRHGIQNTHEKNMPPMSRSDVLRNCRFCCVIA